MGRILLEETFEHIKNEPEKICLANGKVEISYQEYWNIINRGKNYLSNFGLKPGDRICLVGEQNISYLLMLSSAHLLGVTVIPLEKGVSDTRINEILELMETKWVGVRTPKDDICGVQICYDEFDEKCINSKEECNSFVDFNELFQNSPQDILFTTGTTGSPKGIMLSAKAVNAVAHNVVASVGMQKDAVELIICPLFHSMGIRRYYSGLLNGSTVVINSGSSFLEDVPVLMEKYSVTSLVVVPSQATMLLRFHEEAVKKQANNLRYIQTGSTYIAEGTVNKFKEIMPHIALYNIYGLSEAGCTNSKDLNSDKSDVLCVGKLTPESKVVFDVDGVILENTTKDRPGTILVGGDILMDGYWKDPQKTTEVLYDGYLHTEDLGYSDDEGNIYVLGRKSDVITSGGNKISPAEIEGVALKHPDILECACIPVADKIAIQVPKLYVVTRDNVTVEEIRDFLGERLEGFKVPKKIEYINELPKAPNGKILKRLLIEKSQ